MPWMHTETELKLHIPDADIAKVRARLASLPGGRAPPKSAVLQSIYFDTRDRRLARHGISLRVRQQGYSFTQTLKSNRRQHNGLHRVTEEETEIQQTGPDLQAFSRTAPLHALLGDEQLHPVCKTHVERLKREITTPSGVVETAVDTGWIDAGQNRVPIAEVEFESLSGDADHVYRLANALLGHVPALPLAMSKAERGYRLAEGISPAAPHPMRSSTLPPLASAWSLDVVQGCLETYAAALANNLYCVLTDEAPAGPHQARVVLRRLRALCWLAAPVIHRDTRRHIAKISKALGNLIAPLRDADVLVSDIVHPLIDIEEDRDVLDRLTTWRNRVRETVRQGLRDNDATGFALSVSASLIGRHWCRRDGKKAALLTAPFAQLAANALAKDWQRIRPMGNRLAKLDTHDRHALRKDLKRFRYALEIAAASVHGHDTEMMMLLKRLRRVQNSLGQLNDIESVAITPPDLGEAHCNARLASVLRSASPTSSRALGDRLHRVVTQWQKLVPLVPGALAAHTESGSAQA